MLSVNLLSCHTVRNAQDHRIVAEHVMHIVIMHIADRPVLIILSRVRTDVMVRWVKLQVGPGVGTDIPMCPLGGLFWRSHLRKTEFVQIVLWIPIGLFENSG